MSYVTVDGIINIQREELLLDITSIVIIREMNRERMMKKERKKERKGGN